MDLANNTTLHEMEEVKEKEKERRLIGDGNSDLTRDTSGNSSFTLNETQSSK